MNQFETITPIQLLSLPAWIGFKRIAGRDSQRFGFTLAAPRSCSRPSAMMSVNGLHTPYATFLCAVSAPAEIHQPYFTPTRSCVVQPADAIAHPGRALRDIAYRVDLVRLRQRGNSQRYLSPAPV